MDHYHIKNLKVCWHLWLFEIPGYELVQPAPNLQEYLKAPARQKYPGAGWHSRIYFI